MTTRGLAAAAALGLALLWACSSTRTAALRVVLPDGGVACGDANYLGCVNYLQFDVTAGGEFITHCVKVDPKLANLCDVESLAVGNELFQLDPDDEVVIQMRGMRIFPYTTCSPVAECVPRTLFSGATEKVRVGDVASGTIDLSVHLDSVCGPREESFPRVQGQSCAARCAGAGGSVVCDVANVDCLCVFPPDGGH